MNKRMNWWLGLALVLPLIVSNRAIEVGLPRFLWLAVFCLVFIGYFYLFRVNRWAIDIQRPLSQGLCALALAFLVILVVTSFSAINKQEALYCTARFLLTSLATFLFTVSVIQEPEHLSRLLKGLAVVLIIQSVVGILQFYGIAFIELPPATNERPYGLMFHRTIFASGLALLFPFCGYLAYRGNLKWKIVSGIALWLGVYALILAKSRSPWVALAFGIVVSNLLVLSLRRRLGAPLVQGWLRGMSLFVVGTIVAALVVVKTSGDPEFIGLLRNRALSLIQPWNEKTTVGSGTGRLIIWRESLQMMRDQPILGVGPGNWRLAAPRYGFHADHVLPNSDQVVVPDRAHNVYLQTGAETGVMGLVIYLGLWGVAVLVALRVVLEADRNDHRILGIASLAGIIIYSVDSIFSFSNEFIAHSLFVAFAMGMSLGIYEQMPRRSARAPVSFSVHKAYLLLPLTFLIFCAYLAQVRLNFEDRMRRSMAYERSADPNRFQKILAEVEAGRSALVSISPRGLPLDFYGARAYEGLGQLDKALESIQRARAVSPWHILVWMETGIVYYKLARWDDAIRCQQEILRMAPTYDRALRDLAITYQSAGMFRESSEVILKLPQDEALLQVLASNYLQTQQYDQAAAALREGLRHFPDSSDLIERLAVLEYTNLNDLSGAYEHFRRLLVLNPNHPKRDEYTKVINFLAPQIPKPLRESTAPGSKY